MRRRSFLVLLAAAVASAGVGATDAGDPAGTVALRIESGGEAPIAVGIEANVLCDDPAVAAADYADGGGMLVRGVKPGTTLCGVWLPAQTPGGLYRVTVVAAERPQADGGARERDGSIAGGGSGDGGASTDAGRPDAG